MNIMHEDLWAGWDPARRDCVWVVTTNSFVARDGLVMGRGAALQATQRIPGIRQIAARKVPHLGTYGFRVVGAPDVGYLGLFQVKAHWRDNASLDLIKVSAQALHQWGEAHPNVRIRMNYPGIGNGRLSREQVETILLQELGDLEQLTVCLLPVPETLAMAPRQAQLAQAMGTLEAQAQFFRERLPRTRANIVGLVILVGRPTPKQVKAFPSTWRNFRLEARTSNGYTHRYGGSLEGRPEAWTHRPWSERFCQQSDSHPMPDEMARGILPLVAELPVELLASAFPKWEKPGDGWEEAAQKLNIL